MELVVLVEDLADGINLEEFSATTVSYVAAEVGYLVFELDVEFMAQNADGGTEEWLGADVRSLIDEEGGR